MWLIFAFSGPVLWAVSIHMDKYIIERFFKRSSVDVLIVFTALTGLVPLPPISAFQPEVFAVPIAGVAVIAASGMLYMGGMSFYLRALQTEETSAVALLLQLTPLLSFALAYLALGEVLSLRELAGSVLIIAGALMVSIGPGSGRAMFRLRLLTLMLGCALALAAASTIFKVFAVQEEFWPTIFWTFVGEAAVGAILLMTPGCRCRLASSFEANAGAVLAINGANELINLGGGLGARYALLFAPVGLVQAIAGTTSIFVFLFGGLLTVLAPRLGGEDLSPRNLVGKSAAVAVVALGVALTGASA